MKSELLKLYQNKKPTCPDCEIENCFIKSCKDASQEFVSNEKLCIYYRKGQQVITEGQLIVGLHFIYSGKVKVSTSWAGEKEQIIRFAKTGDILGFRGFGTKRIKSYIISVTAIDECLICFVESKKMKELLDNNIQLSNHLLHFYADELIKIELRTKVVSQKPVRERVAISLLQLYNIYGVENNGKKTIDVTLDRQELANFVSTTRENISSFISEFKKDKLIDTEGKKIIISDYDKLLSICNLNGFKLF